MSRIAAIPLTANVERRNPRTGQRELHGIDVEAFDPLPPECSTRELARLDCLGSLSLPNQTPESLLAEREARVNHYRQQRSAFREALP
jgi:hypothetical protein